MVGAEYSGLHCVRSVRKRICSKLSGVAISRYVVAVAEHCNAVPIWACGEHSGGPGIDHLFCEDSDHEAEAFRSAAEGGAGSLRLRCNTDYARATFWNESSAPSYFTGDDTGGNLHGSTGREFKLDGVVAGSDNCGHSFFGAVRYAHDSSCVAEPTAGRSRFSEWNSCVASHASL